MFENREVHLGIGALTLEVVDFKIVKPRKTRVREASDPVEREMPDSLAGVVFGRGSVEFSRSQGAIIVDGDEKAIVPHGLFEKPSAAEQAAHPTAEWKFSFDYTEMPTVHPM
jgi:hypothetical protein